MTVGIARDLSRNLQQRLAPDAIRWREENANRWAILAADRRAAGAPVDLTIARAIEAIVRDLRAEIAAANAALVADPRINDLETGLARCARRVDAAGIVWNGGEIMASVRDGMRAKLAQLRGEAPPPPEAAPAPTSLTPPAEPLPFTAGPQLTLFGAMA